MLPPTPAAAIQCIVLYDYDPAKSSPSESPHQELHVMEGNLLKCYGQEVDYGYTMAEVRTRMYMSSCICALCVCI